MLWFEHFLSTPFIRSEQGTLLADPIDIRNDWDVYYEKLYAESGQVHFDNVFEIKIKKKLDHLERTLKWDEHLEGRVFTNEGVKYIIFNLKLRKAPGGIKLLLNILTITSIMNCWVHLIYIQVQLKRGLLVPIPKANKYSSFYNLFIIILLIIWT